MKTGKILVLILMILLTGGGCGYGSYKEEKEEDFKVSVVDTGADKATADTAGNGDRAGGEDPETFVSAFICGEVQKPGVYEIAAGSRVDDLLEAAGGFTENASRDYVNLARVVADGEMIEIPSAEEAENMKADPQGQIRRDERAAAEGNGLININTADSKALQTLPGIGETRADAIIKYRNEHGPFGDVGDIKKVNGIGESTYNTICELITI